MDDCEPPDAGANAAEVTVLVIATNNAPQAARIATALADTGFSVATLTPHGHPMRRLRGISDHFTYHTRPRLKSIIRAIDRSSPELLVCADDLAVRELHALHQRIVASDDNARRNISELIELSLGPATSFPAMRNKSDFLALAEIEGLRAPRTSVVPAARAFESASAQLTCPIVIKADHSYGGLCVRYASSEFELRTAVWELQTPTQWRRIFRRVFGAVLRSDALRSVGLRLRRTISLQQYIAGHAGNRAVACWKGKVLAGISVEAVEVTHESGPASVVRLIDHPEMTMATEHMVKRLELSGFMGFDFVLDCFNQAWMIELNPRVTPISHFRLADGTNLAGSLYTQMTGLRPRSTAGTITRSLIALFPNEVVRCPSGEYLQSCEHDVPWNEPELVCSVLNRTLRVGIVRRARAFLERYFPAAIGALVQLGLVEPSFDKQAAL